MGGRALKRQRGLSPLARGTQSTHAERAFNRRFIPAGAGNTTAALSDGRLLPVYPRWRGEHSLMWPANSLESGLSPLARGTRLPMKKTPDAERFIPAGAGNTLGRAPVKPESPVYPRWRGEHGFCVG